MGLAHVRGKRPAVPGVARKAREIQLFLGVDAYLHVLSLISFYMRASGTNGSGDTHQPTRISLSMFLIRISLKNVFFPR